MSLALPPRPKKRRSLTRIWRKLSRLATSVAQDKNDARLTRKPKIRLENLPPVEQLRHVNELQAEVIVKQLTREAIEREYADDPFFRNYCLNLWEYVHGVDVLTTYPWNVALPLADLCNARCTFCTS